MTISSNVTRADYVANGNTTEFAFQNRVFAASHLAVFLNGVLQSGGYRVEDLDTSEANVIFDVAPTNGTAVALVSVIPIEQTTAFKNQGRFNAEVHEDEFDRTNLRILKNEGAIDSGIRLPTDEIPKPETTIVPSVEERVASFFIWDGVGNIIAVKVEDLLEYIGDSKTAPGDGLYSVYDLPTNTTTFNVGGGPGITVNADNVEIEATTLALINSALQTAGAGVIKVGTTIDVGQGAGITVNADNIQINQAYLDILDLAFTEAGAGLTNTGRELNVGQGTGLTVNADDVQISQENLTILGNADFGNIGKQNQNANSGDLDLDIRSGMYHKDAGAPNNPNSEAGLLLVVGGNNDVTAQMFFDRDLASGPLNCYYRTQDVGVWSAWDVFVTTQNVLDVLNAAYVSFVDDGVSTPQHTNVQDGLAAALTAIGTRFNPATTLLTATDVQVAIEQVITILEMITSGVQFAGVWNADANTPPIDTYTPLSGEFYIVSVAGTTDLSNPPGTPDPAGDPLNNWEIADIAIYDAIPGDQGYVGWNRRPDAGRITTAQGVVFDNTNYVATFPGDANPPTTSQTAHDKVWGFAKQTLDSNVGKEANSGLVDVIDISAASFDVSLTTTLNHPAQTTEKVSLISGLSDVAGSFGLLGFTAASDPRLFVTNINAGVISPWLEAYTLTAPRTKDSVDTILDNADYSNAGKASPLGYTGDLDDLVRPGFYHIESSLAGNPFATHSTVLVATRNSEACTQTIVEMHGNRRTSYRSQSTGAWTPWKQLFASEVRTSDEANTILDNADVGNIGKETITDYSGDLNDIVNTGFYHSIASALNTPAATGGRLIHINRSADEASQFFIENTTIPTSHFRSKVANVWGSWVEVVDNAADQTIKGKKLLQGVALENTSLTNDYVDITGFLSQEHGSDRLWIRKVAVADNPTSWQGKGFRLQRQVDSTLMNFIEMRENATHFGVAGNDISGQLRSTGFRSNVPQGTHEADLTRKDYVDGLIGSAGGNWGLGEIAVVVADADAVRISKLDRTDGTTLGLPDGVNKRGSLMTVMAEDGAATGETHIYQEFYPINYNGAAYSRGYSSSQAVWSDWVEVITQDRLSTYVTTNTAQTITAEKTIAANMVFDRTVTDTAIIKFNADGVERGYIGRTSDSTSVTLGAYSDPVVIYSTIDVRVQAPQVVADGTIQAAIGSSTWGVGLADGAFKVAAPDDTGAKVLLSHYTEGTSSSVFSLQSYNHVTQNEIRTYHNGVIGIKCSAVELRHTGDIVAFSGDTLLATTTPLSAATGKTTAYQLIEHLLEKIEELEARLDILETP